MNSKVVFRLDTGQKANIYDMVSEVGVLWIPHCRNMVTDTPLMNWEADDLAEEV